MNKDNKKNKKKIKFTVSSLLMNNRFLIISSFVVAFVLWLWVAIEQSPIVTRVVENVPVKIENSVSQNKGLQVFGKDSFDIDITVTGKKYIVSSLKSSDFQVIAKTDTITSSGKAHLKLYVQAIEESVDFTISDYSESSIEVFFDKLESKDIDVKFTMPSNVTVKKDCRLGEPEISTSNKISVSGPSSILNNIDYIEASVYTTSNYITSSQTGLSADFSVKTKDNSEIDTSMFTFNEEKFDSLTENYKVNIPLYKIVTLDAAVKFENVPSEMPVNSITYKITPSKVQAAIRIEDYNDDKYYYVVVIDCANIDNIQNNFTVNVNESYSFDIFDDLGNDFDVFDVTIDTSQLK